MFRKVCTGIALCTCFAAWQLATVPSVSAKELKVLSEKTVTGFGHVESVAYDPKEKVLYTSDFGPALKPADKDGQGKITKVSLDGKILEDGAIKPPGNAMNKPKGIWIKGRHLWVTDIDSVWEFDLKTKEGKKLPLPGAEFANDPTIVGNVLYVSDNRADQLFSVEPADFMKSKQPPKITVVFKGKGVFPNGLYPGKRGTLLMVGYEAKDKPQPVYEMALPNGEPKPISDKLGFLDGLYRMKNGDLIVTDWVTGSVFQWNKKLGRHDLATDFKGPADLCVVQNDKGLLVIIPDLVKGELRFVQLGK